MLKLTPRMEDVLKKADIERGEINDVPLQTVLGSRNANWCHLIGREAQLPPPLRVVTFQNIAGSNFPLRDYSVHVSCRGLNWGIKIFQIETTGGRRHLTCHPCDISIQIEPSSLSKSLPPQGVRMTR